MEEEEKHRKGQGFAIGLALGIPLGIPIGLLMDNLAIGPAIGVAIGAGLGAAMEHAYRNRETPENRGRSRRMKIIVAITVGLFAGGVIALTIIYLLTR